MCLSLLAFSWYELLPDPLIQKTLCPFKHEFFKTRPKWRAWPEEEDPAFENNPICFQKNWGCFPASSSGFFIWETCLKFVLLRVLHWKPPRKEPPLDGEVSFHQFVMRVLSWDRLLFVSSDRFLIDWNPWKASETHRLLDRVVYSFGFCRIYPQTQSSNTLPSPHGLKSSPLRWQWGTLNRDNDTSPMIPNWPLAWLCWNFTISCKNSVSVKKIGNGGTGGLNYWLG